MNWNDYEGIWKRQKLPVGASAELGSLIETFETKRRKMASVLFARDLLEGGTGLLGCMAFGFMWWKVGKAGWPIAFAMILILWVVGVFAKERVNAHRNRLGPSAPLLAKVDADIAVLRQQRRLVLRLWQWYLGPTAASMVIVCLTISFSRPPWDIARDPVFLGGFGVFFAFLLWFAWETNRRAVHKQIDPRLEELEKLRSEITFSRSN